MHSSRVCQDDKKCQESSPRVGHHVFIDPKTNRAVRVMKGYCPSSLDVASASGRSLLTTPMPTMCPCSNNVHQISTVESSQCSSQQGDWMCHSSDRTLHAIELDRF
jgi:hypothetical protein